MDKNMKGRVMFSENITTIESYEENYYIHEEKSFKYKKYCIKGILVVERL